MDGGWLGRLTGLPPPAGSLPAVLLACGWDWAGVLLFDRGSWRNSPPQAVFWTDVIALHLRWPYLISTNRIRCNLTALTGGLGASSLVAAPFRQGALSGTYPIPIADFFLTL